MTNLRQSKVYDEEFSGIAEEHLSIGEAAEIFGVSYDAARRAGRRRGFKLTPESERTIRDKAERMRPLEAVEYLLYVLEQLAAVNKNCWHPVDEICTTLTTLERRMLIAIYDAARPIPKDALYTAIYFDRAATDDLPGDNVIAVMISKLRKKLPDGFRITRGTQQGYALVRRSSSYQ